MALRGAEKSEFRRLAFSHEYKEPILRGDKTATVRLGSDSISAGEDVVLITDNSVEFAYARIHHTFTTAARNAAETISYFDAEHPVADGEVTIYHALQKHYDEPIQKGTVVKGIVFSVTEPLARVPEEGGS